MSQAVVVALAGNPNAGKTTLFNAITGARQHVGNYPGITVEKKEGYASLEGTDFHVVDLPGTYSLTAYSQEELVARNYVVEERPGVIVDVVNAGALERNLFLTVQFLELGAPLVLALNMMDEAKKRGLRIDSQMLSCLLGTPVVETVARSGAGVAETLRAAASEATERAGRPWSPLILSYGPDLDPALQDMERLIEQEQFLTDRYAPRWTALKYLEGDEEVRARGRKAGPLSRTLEDIAARVATHCQATLDTWPEAVIADYRYGFIASMLKQGVLRREPLQERIDFSDRLDNFLTHRIFGPLAMLAVLFLVYQITFTLGDAPMQWTAAAFEWLEDMVNSTLPEGMLRSMLASGVIAGVGGVMSFVPLIMIIFLLIAFLEDSGYMARVAYMLDRVFRIFGLHGASVMPFIVGGGLGGGCAVPGVLAARTLRSPREKLATLLTVPFMNCGAKLPVFILLSGVLFPGQEALALFLITLFGWAIALLVAWVLRSTVIRGPATPFVMELPPYRFPTVRGLLIHSCERIWQYMKKAGTMILAISIVVWAAMTFPGPTPERQAAFEAQRSALEQTQTAPTTNEAGSPASPPGQDTPAASEAPAVQLRSLEGAYAEETLRGSVAGRLGTWLSPLSRLAGFDWRTNIALIGGFSAKEVIIATLATAYAMSGDNEASEGLAERLRKDPDWTPRRGIALMIFILLYAPCLATVVAIRQESGSWGWAAFSVAFNTLLAYGLAVLAYQGGALL